METTVADMNVEGFRWYDPKKKAGKKEVPKLTKKEQKALVRGAYRALLPMIACMLAAFGLMMGLAWLWLQ